MRLADIEQRMNEVLHEATCTLFPLVPHPSSLIKRHVWRDRRYLGEHDGKVLAWRGRSANLVQLDFRYRAVFIDLVDNLLPLAERHRLFGPAFAEKIQPYDQFIILFVLDFPVDSLSEIQAQGFTPRLMSRSLHACVIASPDEFLSHSASHWTAKVVRLVLLQRVLSTHRKPLDANEVPFQNLLYRSGYLHSYIIRSGLQLHKLSPPRRAGGFGHDLHAVVYNPHYSSVGPLDLGIEVYNAGIGYHSLTIPDYVKHFDLSAMLVIAKDDPFPALESVRERFPRPLGRMLRLDEIGDPSFIGIHHLPLDNVIFDLQAIQDEMSHLLAT